MKRDKLLHVFSSAADLEAQGEAAPYFPRREAPGLGPGQDLLFDAVTGEPLQPRPNRLSKVFSGSALDLDDGAVSTGADDGNGNESDTGATPPTLSGMPRPGFFPARGPSAPQPPAQSNFFDLMSPMGAQLSSSATFTSPNVGPAPLGPVLVFGATSFLGGHVVATLLQRGYAVRCALEEDRQAGLAELHAMSAGAQNRLSVVAVNPLSAASVLDAIRRSGCRFIIYCGLSASAVASAGKMPATHAAAAEAAAGGPSAASTAAPGSAPIDAYSRAAQALFDSIRNLKSGAPAIERIVFTGSTAAIAHPTDPCPMPLGFDESHRNTKVTPQEDPLAYAKCRFEEEVWRLGGLVHVGVSVVIPSLMLGPTLTGETSEAVRVVHDQVRASKWVPFAPDMAWNYTDVRDVALAHVRALEVPEATGKRFIVSNRLCTYVELGQMLRQINPALHPPKWAVPNVLLLASALVVPGMGWAFLRHHLGKRRPLNGASAVRVLGLHLTPLEATLRACLTELESRGDLQQGAAASSLVGVEGVSSPGPLSSSHCLPTQTHRATVILRGVAVAGLVAAAAYALLAATRHRGGSGHNIASRFLAKVGMSK